MFLPESTRVFRTCPGAKKGQSIRKIVQECRAMPCNAVHVSSCTGQNRSMAYGRHILPHSSYKGLNLWTFNISMENQHCKNMQITLEWAIFHSYVTFPEGKLGYKNEASARPGSLPCSQVFRTPRDGRGHAETAREPMADIFFWIQLLCSNTWHFGT